MLGARLIIIVDWRRRNYTALEGRSVLNIRFYYYENRRSGVRTTRWTAGDGGRRRLRAITFDIRYYRSAVGVAARRGRLRGHSAGVRGAGAGQRGRVASARGPPLSELDRRSAAPRRRCAPAFYIRLKSK